MALGSTWMLMTVEEDGEDEGGEVADADGLDFGDEELDRQDALQDEVEKVRKAER